MKKLLRAILCSVFLLWANIAIAGDGASGGNGSGGITHLEAEIETQILTVKDKLLEFFYNVDPTKFESSMARAAFTELIQAGLIEDIWLHGDYNIQAECIDKDGHKKMATAVVGDRLTPVCWSLNEIANEVRTHHSVNLAQLILGTAIHEHAHRLGFDDSPSKEWGAMLGQEAYHYLIARKFIWVNQRQDQLTPFQLPEQILRNVINAMNMDVTLNRARSAVKLSAGKKLKFGITPGIGSAEEFWRNSRNKELRAAEKVLTSAIQEVFDVCSENRKGIVTRLYVEEHRCWETSAVGISDWACYAEVKAQCVYNTYDQSGVTRWLDFFKSDWSQDDDQRADEFRRQLEEGHIYETAL